MSESTEQNKDVILAFSGGLDTSFCVPYLIDQGYRVTTIFVDSGGVSDEEIQAIRDVFTSSSQTIPLLSSTKSLTGHSLGAAGVHETIYSLLMMENSFITASANIESMDEAVTDMPIVTKMMDNQPLETIMTNNFGFGGTNACLILQKNI